LNPILPGLDVDVDLVATSKAGDPNNDLKLARRDAGLANACIQVAYGADVTVGSDLLEISIVESNVGVNGVAVALENRDSGSSGPDVSLLDNFYTTDSVTTNTGPVVASGEATSEVLTLNSDSIATAASEPKPAGSCSLEPEHDADGDGVCDAGDSCPLDVENDADGDGVCEDVDNCPLIANDNQTDQDDDLVGDVCDADIDGDGDLNDDDNCPFDMNSDQSDVDGDGAGDVCDSDQDGDGVPDQDDACVPSPQGEVVNADGCAVSELCPCAHAEGENLWKNHGAYVSCVAHTTNDFVELGLLTEEEKDAIQSEAGGSSCGRKNK
jgi:hypothetical protein